MMYCNQVFGETNRNGRGGLWGTLSFYFFSTFTLNCLCAAVQLATLPSSFAGNMSPPLNGAQFRLERYTQTLWYGKKYTYRIDIEGHGDKDNPDPYMGHEDQLCHGIRELTIGKPSQQTTAIPIRMLHTSKNPGEPHIGTPDLVTFWEAFNTRESRHYYRNLLHDNDGTRRWSDGSILRGASIAVISIDPLFQALIASAVQPFRGQPRLPKSNFDATGKEVWTIVPEPHRLDPNAFRIIHIDPSVRLESHIGSAPEYLPLVQKRSDTDFFEIDEIKTVDGIRYPGKARFAAYDADGTFELLDVADIDIATNEWFPDWDRGTWVSDKVRGKTTEIPYNTEEMDLIINNIFKLRQEASPDRTSTGVWINIAIVSIIAILAGVRYSFAFRRQE
ncbi:hypothetical protein SH528x_001040 [Novipirellula sp. SH528]|uniref:hypothetical protein n=1 Tax=Novipirellula sp. SH528 TaxID=3454466 RepID=UPI003F9EE793